MDSWFMLPFRSLFSIQRHLVKSIISHRKLLVFSNRFWSFLSWIFLNHAQQHQFSLFVFMLYSLPSSMSFVPVVIILWAILFDGSSLTKILDSDFVVQLFYQLIQCSIRMHLAYQGLIYRKVISLFSTNTLMYYVVSFRSFAYRAVLYIVWDQERLQICFPTMLMKFKISCNFFITYG